MRPGPPQDRRAVHLALAAATDARADPERRVWHLAAAATGPDEDVAAELDRAAGRVQARAGLAAAAAFLQRSVALTAEPGRRAGRALAAAEANLYAGAFDAALGLLAQAEADAVDDLQRARVEQLRDRSIGPAAPGGEAPARLLHAAEKPRAARSSARPGHLPRRLVASLVAGPLAAARRPSARGLPSGTIGSAATARSAARRPAPRWSGDDDRSTGALRHSRACDGQSTHSSADQVSPEDWLKWGLLGSERPSRSGTVTSWAVVSTRHLDIARASGALAPLSAALNAQRVLAIFFGDFETADGAGRGGGRGQGGDRGAEGFVRRHAARRLSGAAGGSVGADRREHQRRDRARGGTRPASRLLGGSRSAQRSRSLRGSLGRGGTGRQEEQTPFVSASALQELIEAAARSGQAGRGADALRRLSVMTAVGRSDWAAGIEARSTALLSHGQEAEHYYADAVERLGRTPLRPELARAHLVYGEWLRRENRRVDARHQLRSAYDLFTAIGADAFAERARRELVATGEKVRKREVDTLGVLTPQEEHIARLAHDGRTNPEIGAELFLSARTVEWHLRKIFIKLGVTSRKGLHDALPPRQRHPPSASRLEDS